MCCNRVFALEEWLTSRHSRQLLRNKLHVPAEVAFPILIGVPSLDHLVLISHDEEKFSKVIERLTARMANITVVATLAVSATVGFLTTTPPTPYAAWDKEFPYIFIAGACGSAILSAASGLGLIMYLGVVTPESVQGLKNGGIEFWVTLVLMMVPTLFLFITAGAGFLAWLGAVWCGNKLWMKLLVTALTLVCSALIVMLFLIIPILY
ncbi:hypothetical protein BKA82DRAFT_319809 [Pisolithus tinctorius]|uniref:Uncharacterized protein n=1 Tax=Pisolithus tinctorius Marx 270 TaxID=870435 RepID=A0A0C3JCD0_PISTI|nr:hypothetical protein BKA82DRAFT_319809 [Pisolithus tinctorius]KIN95316.1 hypothetical protein M404DRAFT_319809 [Pisolithus tinctorius Marx 270]